MKVKKCKRKIVEGFAPIVPIKLSLDSKSCDHLSFLIKFVQGTTEDKIRKHLNDVGQMLNLRLFQLYRNDMNLFLVVSKENTFDNRLLGMLTSPAYTEYTKNMAVPYPIGFNVMRRPVILDIASYGHWLIGGANFSGKTVNFQSLITSIAWSRSPEAVNLIIVDGVYKLNQFNGLPHLSCPVIQDSDVSYLVITALFNEMHRRFKLKGENANEFNRLPIIVCFIDECVSFVRGMGGKKDSEMFADTISFLLRKARHVGIYLVLATQNAAVDEMRCDLSPITARIAFRCSKPQQSVTILGEGGAEKLSGKGDMYFISPNHSGLEYLKGAYITSAEIEAVCNHIRVKYEETEWDDSNKFLIDFDGLQQNDVYDGSIRNPVIIKQDTEDKLFAKIILWTLNSYTVSAKKIMDTFKISWLIARECLERLFTFGIVDVAHEKLPRKVIPVCFEDMQPETIAFLERYGYTEEQIRESLDTKTK